MGGLILVSNSEGKETLLNLDNVAYATSYETQYSGSEVSGTNVYFNFPTGEGNPVLFNIPFEEFVNMVGLKEKTSTQKFV